ncbi:MAG: FAD:protein FMN transferase [Micrococcales bacterium]|nr:FAD:protein FMN transferase [Micrococcales bacterium]
MITVGLDTWRTQLRLSVRSAYDSGLERALQRTLDAEVARLDELASRFRTDSTLTRVNTSAGHWVEIPWGFVGVLTACLDAARATGGLVDPTLGRAIKAAGYDQWAGQPTATRAGTHKGAWRGVGIRPGRAAAQVRIPHDTALDLGSIAKGWLADRLAVAVRRGGHDVLANMGGDIRVLASTPWTVWADSELPGVPPAPVDLIDGGVATSGIGHRAWKGGHHIIDPRTGRSAQTPWHAVSVVAATATDANAAATAATILGDDAPAWLAHKGLDARFVSTDTITTTGRWPLEVAA